MTAELGPVARALLDAARDGLTPDAATIRRMRAGIDATVGATAATSAATGGAGATKLTIVKISLVSVVATVAIGSAVYFATTTNRPSDQFASTSTAQPGTGHAGHRATGLAIPAVPAAPGQVAPGQVAPGQTTPGQATPGQAAPGQTTPGRTAPGQAPGQAAPGQTMPGRTAPGQAPGQAAPGQAAPGRIALGQAALGQAAPGQAAPGQAAPGQGAPGQAAPGQAAPGQAAGQSGQAGQAGQSRKRVELAREVELVDLAMAALRRTDYVGALAAARRHVLETGGNGQLAEDAAAIEIEAMCHLHLSVLAKLEAFDARWPSSAQRSRLSPTCR